MAKLEANSQVVAALLSARKQYFVLNDVFWQVYAKELILIFKINITNQIFRQRLSTKNNQEKIIKLINKKCLFEICVLEIK